MAEQKTKVLLFGLGAIGGFYAFILSRNQDVSLSVVARSNYESVEAKGLTIESQNHGSHQVKLDQVFKSPADVATTFDYIVCAHKAINPEQVPPALKPAVGDQTTFVIIQNGVGNEEPFRNAYPENIIISCVTWVGASQPSPGLIKHSTSENTELGLFHNPRIDSKAETASLNRFARFLKTGGTKFQVEDNIQIKRWEKVVWNVAWNPLTTLTDVDTHTWLGSSEEAMTMTKRLMRDVIDVARRCDVPLDYELIDILLKKILAMPGIFSSMHTDFKDGRPLEVDVIIGYPMKKAREFQMDVPTLTAVYAMITAVNGRLMRNSI